MKFRRTQTLSKEKEVFLCLSTVLAELLIHLSDTGAVIDRKKYFFGRKYEDASTVYSEEPSIHCRVRLLERYTYMY